MFTLQQTFQNLKLFLIGLGLGLILLTIELFHLSQYGERFSALKNQHELINTVITTDLNDPQMAAILINTAMSEIDLEVKKTGSEALLDLFLMDDNEQASLLESLTHTSSSFKNTAMVWSESIQVTRDATYRKMIEAQGSYEHDINALMVYHAKLLHKSITLTKYTVFILLPIFLLFSLFYIYRLNLIAFDVKQAGSVDIDGTVKEIKTKEIDFLIKRLSRKSHTTASTANAVLLHPMSNLLNEKGMQNAFNAKRSNKGANTVFIGLFDIDQYNTTLKELSKDDLTGIYRKIGEIISFYEHPNDVIAQLENDRFVFLLSRNSKDIALNEVQKIVDSVQESTFTSSKGILKLSISAGFLLKPPVKSIDESIFEAGKVLQLAQESGGNRVAQLRQRSDSYN